MKNYKDTPVGRATAHKYADIINMEQPQSSHPHMDLVQRANIFSPYDALRGFDEAIEEANEKTREVKRVYLSDEQKEVLSDKLLQIQRGMGVSVRYFVSGKDTNTGYYVTVTGMVTHIDPVERTIDIQDHTADTTGGKIEKVLPVVINFNDIVEIT